LGLKSNARRWAVYITNIELENIQCFENLSIDLEKDGKPVLWLMIVGDNSVGKSILLKSIALGLCDEASAAALMKEIPGDFLRDKTPIKNKAKTGWIEIKFKRHVNDRNYFTLRTEIKRMPPEAPEKVKQTQTPAHEGDVFPWEDIIVCGYGPQRAAEANTSYDEYDPLAAVYTLFNYESTLQNPELILRRQPARRKERWKKKILEVLMLNKDDYNITLDNKGMYIDGRWGKQPFWTLSDGYRSTVSWVLDFIAWHVYAFKPGDRIDFRGVLLIDEIEQHLHPKWQRYIVERLRKQFQKTQFITTTHSPLVTLGVSDIENVKVLSLKRSDQKITYEEVDPVDLKGLRVDQALTSDAFNLPIARSGKSGDKIVRFRDLYLKEKLTTEEQDEFDNLKMELRKDAPNVFEREEDRKMHYEIFRLLSDLGKSSGEKGS
jgi:predicted ATPase